MHLAYPLLTTQDMPKPLVEIHHNTIHRRFYRYQPLHPIPFQDLSQSILPYTYHTQSSFRLLHLITRHIRLTPSFHDLTLRYSSPNLQ
jgi:hypothetical protein